MDTKILSANKKGAIQHAADILRNGGLVAFPTDTVYGLAAMAFIPKLANGLYTAKGRNHSKAIAILLSTPEELNQVTDTVSPMARILAETYWPGPLTLIFPRANTVPDAVSSLPTVGVRIPDHPIALELLKITGPLAVTSANRSDLPNTRTAAEVKQQLSGRIHLILDGGRAPGGNPSTVVDCTEIPPKILRTGPISIQQITSVLTSVQ